MSFFLRLPSKVTNFNTSPMPPFWKFFIRYIEQWTKTFCKKTGRPAGQPAMNLKFTGLVGSRKSWPIPSLFQILKCRPKKKTFVSKYARISTNSRVKTKKKLVIAKNAWIFTNSGVKPQKKGSLLQNLQKNSSWLVVQNLTIALNKTGFIFYWLGSLEKGCFKIWTLSSSSLQKPSLEKIEWNKNNADWSIKAEKIADWSNNHRWLVDLCRFVCVQK